MKRYVALFCGGLLLGGLVSFPPVRSAVKAQTPSLNYYATVTRYSNEVGDEILTVTSPAGASRSIYARTLYLSTNVNGPIQLSLINNNNGCTTPLTIRSTSGADLYGAPVPSSSQARTACTGLSPQVVFHQFYLTAKSPLVVDLSAFQFQAGSDNGLVVNVPVATNGTVSATIVWSEQ